MNEPSSLPIGDAAFTTSFWFRDDGSNNGDGLLHWGKNDASAANGQEIRSGGWQHYFFSNDLTCSNIGLEDGEWHHLVVTFDPATDTRAMYMDGELKCSDDPGTVNVNGSKIQIGNGDASETLQNGFLDQVRVYNRSLSKQEIWKLYTMGRDRSGSDERAGPVAHWPLGSSDRRQVDRAGSNTGNWSSAGPATEKRYIVNEYHAGRGLAVVSYGDSNTLDAGSCSKRLNRGDTYTFPSSCYSVGDVVKGEKPFSAHFQAFGSDGPVPASFKGTEFVYQDCRSAEYFNIVAPEGSASVTVSNSTGTVTTTTVSAGGHKEINTDMPGSVYKITSDNPVFVTYDRSMGDTFMMRPMTKELYGMIEDILVGKDSTDVQVYSSDGGKIHDGNYNSYTRLGGEDSGQDGSKTVHAVADKKALGGYRCADGDNGETDIGVSDNDLANEWYLPEPVAGTGNNNEDYYFSLTTSGSGKCSVYWPNGTKALTKSTSASPPYPGYIGFDIYNELNITSAGARVSCTTPSAMQWEPSNYEGEANLYGVRETPEGKRGSSIKFDGKNDVVSLEEDMLTANQDFSVSFWSRSDQLDVQRPLTLRGDVRFVPEFRSGGTLRIWVDGSWHENLATYESKKWNHWSIVYDDSSSGWKLFKNGKKVSSFTDSLTSANNQNLIGADYWSGSSERHFDGRIDDVRVYPYALSQEQVKQVMNGGGVSSSG